jgi:hypothetical protein
LLHTERTVIARKLAGWTSAVKLNATDATDLILRHVPAPGCNRIPFLDRDLHLRTKSKKKRYMITEGELDGSRNDYHRSI